MQLHCLDCKQTYKKHKSKNKSIKHEKQTTFNQFNQLNSKTPELQGRQFLFIDWKQNKKHNKSIKKQIKWDNYQKPNQHRNRKAETYTMKTKTKTTKRKIYSQKWKQLRFQKGGVSKFCFKEQAPLGKEKARKIKTKEPPPKITFSKTGLIDKKQRQRWSFEREDKRTQGKKLNRKKRRILKTGLLGHQNSENL